MKNHRDTYRSKQDEHFSKKLSIGANMYAKKQEGAVIRKHIYKWITASRTQKIRIKIGAISKTSKSCVDHTIGLSIKNPDEFSVQR